MFNRLYSELKRPYWWFRSLFAKKVTGVPFPENWVVQGWAYNHRDRIWCKFLDNTPLHDERYEYDKKELDRPFYVYVVENGLNKELDWWLSCDKRDPDDITLKFEKLTRPFKMIVPGATDEKTDNI